MKTTILISLMLVGCERPGHIPIVNIAPEAQPFVNRFVQTAHAEGIQLEITDLQINFVNDIPSDRPGTTTLGECFMGGPDSTPHIRLNRSSWVDMDELLHEALVYHELGHCILRREHDESFITDLGEGIPKSIMYPYLLDEGVYLRHHDHYLIELFNWR